MRIFTSLLLFFLAIFCVCKNSDAKLPFIVKTVYFQPTDAPDVDKEKISRLMLDAQALYSQEMERHGYGRKTFRLEIRNGSVVAHVVKGRNDIEHYSGSGRAAFEELQLNFMWKNPNNMTVIFVGGVDGFLLPGQFFGVEGFAQCFDGWVCGGFVTVGHNPHLRIVAHELGHTFGLMHDFQSPDTFMSGAGRVPHREGKKLQDFEARWLDKHHYFNTVHKINAVPNISKVGKPKRIKKDGESYIEFNMNVESVNGLHQVQLSRESDAVCVGWTEVNGNNDPVQFFVMEKLLVHQHIRINNLPFVEKSLLFQVLDIQGNHRMEFIDFILPLEVSSHQKSILPWAKIKAERN